jgi:HD superfamily phosphohydrolase
MPQPKRIRDPIHGLILFNREDEINPDDLAWNLIQQPEFQRLRRIKQLGISEFVYPGATHTRFAHSIGVYHNARRLMDVVRRSEGGRFDPKRARVVLSAALLHDLGHGPFSHAFEKARENLAHSRGIDAIESHEKLTAKLIMAGDGGIRHLLDGVDQTLAQDIAELIRADDPADIYHAVVSSSFDADRLDYLLRDRYMTGTGAGAIDCDWLIDNLATDHIRVGQDDDPDHTIPTFSFKFKGREAAEDFLFARYRLYTQVYLHRVTRGFEQVITALVRRIGEIGSDDPALIGLDIDHPLVRFLRPDGGALEDYRDLDDTVVWGAIERIRRGRDQMARDLAERLWLRKPLEVIDISTEFGDDPEKMACAHHRLADFVAQSLDKTVYKDEASYNLYTRTKGDTAKEHKKVRVRHPDSGVREITDFADTVIKDILTTKRKMVRYYFLCQDEREAAERAMRGK